MIIKIRIWDKINNKMIDSYDIPFEFSDWNFQEFFDVILEVSEESDYIVQQYTGLKDKNGREICAGDILHHCDQNYIVQPFCLCQGFTMQRI